MPTEFYGLLQELDSWASPEILGQESYFPSDIAQSMGDRVYRILKISSNQAEVDAVLSFMKEGDALTLGKVIKKPGARDGEIKWEVLM